MNTERIKVSEVSLPKWPAFTVEGASVTREQAAEILVRTNNWFLGTNDRAWEAEIMRALGVPVTRENGYTQVSWGKVAVVRERIGVLPLEYLYNRRVASAWVGGPHGWCDWEGRIGCSSYNLGKWPTVKAVRAEWVLIAEAFPFLNLRAQLWSGETSEEGVVPLVEFVVRGGKVRTLIPKSPLGAPTFEMTVDLTDPPTTSERGCDLSTLQWAIDLTRGRMSEPARDWDRLLG